MARLSGKSAIVTGGAIGSARAVDLVTDLDAPEQAEATTRAGPV